MKGATTKTMMEMDLGGGGWDNHPEHREQSGSGHYSTNQKDFIGFKEDLQQYVPPF